MGSALEMTINDYLGKHLFGLTDLSERDDYIKNYYKVIEKATNFSLSHVGKVYVINFNGVFRRCLSAKALGKTICLTAMDYLKSKETVKR